MAGVDSASNRNEYQEPSWGGGGGGNVRPARKADNLTAICDPQRLTTLWASMAWYRDSFTFTFMNKRKKEKLSLCLTN
jgi:hypothetical protein